jgi:hypothetical protein
LFICHKRRWDIGTRQQTENGKQKKEASLPKSDIGTRQQTENGKQKGGFSA